MYGSELVFFLYHFSYILPVINRFSLFQELQIAHITACTKLFFVCKYILFRFYTINVGIFAHEKTDYNYK